MVEVEVIKRMEVRALLSIIVAAAVAEAADVDGGCVCLSLTLGFASLFRGGGFFAEDAEISDPDIHFTPICYNCSKRGWKEKKQNKY
jgi:hypothetical protein